MILKKISYENNACCNTWIHRLHNICVDDEYDNGEYTRGVYKDEI